MPLTNYGCVKMSCLGRSILSYFETRIDDEICIIGQVVLVVSSWKLLIAI